MPDSKPNNNDSNLILPNKKEQCGIIMPISTIDRRAESHWTQVREIISASINDAGFEANLVSNADETGVIQKRIIQNLYENPIVVCDVSGKNPNVMFELGMRLAFDKPTVIIKDNETSYSFDTSPIEHIEYPLDLRYPLIVEFKKRLTEKITKTYEMSKSDKEYSTFLKHFGEFKIAKITTKEVGLNELVLDELRLMKDLIYTSMRNTPIVGTRPSSPSTPVSPLRTYLHVKIKFEGTSKEATDKVTSLMAKIGCSGSSHGYANNILNINFTLDAPNTPEKAWEILRNDSSLTNSIELIPT